MSLDNLNGDLQNQPCVLDNVTIQDGEQREFFQNSTVACGQTCLKSMRICHNGVLSGDTNFNKKSCTVSPCSGASCSLPWGGTIVDGESVISYQTSNVPYGQVCQSELRVCRNGILSGSFTNAACDVQSPPGNPNACPSTIMAPDTEIGSSARYRKVTADVQYGVVPDGTVRNFNITEFIHLWGYNSAQPSKRQNPVPWPGLIGSSPGFMMQRNQYVALHFKTPPASQPPRTTSGYFSTSTYASSDPITVSIRKGCGDFSGVPRFVGGSVNPSGDPCFVSYQLADDSGNLNWIFNSSAPQHFCKLEPETDYYINIMFATTKNTNMRCTTADETGLCRMSYVRR